MIREFANSEKSTRVYSRVLIFRFDDWIVSSISVKDKRIMNE